ncbi:MAG: porin family protein [Rickettsiales bacterium]|jgi:opacity protein-like surface antigen|nr:porin family protein [Rickettsiales bacterium]
MKKSLMALSVISIFAATSTQAGFYGSVGLGAVLAGQYKFEDGSKPKAKFDAPAYSLAIGYELPIWNIRVEAEYLRLQSDFKHDPNLSMITSGFMLNGYVPLPVPLISPYIGVGIGTAETTLFLNDSNGGLQAKPEFAYQAILGAEVDIPFISTVGIELRYVHSEGDITIGEDQYVKNDILALFLKARF